MKAVLSEKDKKFRQFSLNAPLMRVTLYVCVPLALYQSLTQLFKIFDTMMASHISANAVSAVAYIAQIQIMLSALGSGLAVGASIKVSEAYGSGDFETVKKRASTMFAMCAALGSAFLLVLLPCARMFLRLMNTPEEFIAEGSMYFRLEIVGLVITFFNNIYIAIERARGNSRRILYLNAAAIAVKLSITAFSVYVLRRGIAAIAVATIVSQSVILLASIINLNQKGNAFGFSLKAITFKKDIFLPMLTVSLPVIIEKAAFAGGKVIVNSMSTVYGALTVGALGISNNIGGIATMPQNGFQDGCAAIVSQNKGAKKIDRSIKAFYCVVLCNVIVGGVLMAASLACLEYISLFFAQGNAEFQQMIKDIYSWEAIGAIPLGVNAAVLGLLYGLGKTKVTLFMNFCRIYLFRVPVMHFLQHYTDFGRESAGIVMAVSNFLSGLLAAVIGVIVVLSVKFKKEKGEDEEAKAAF